MWIGILTVLIFNLTQPRNILEEGLNEGLSRSALSISGGDYLHCLKWCSKAQPEGGQHHAQVWGFEQCNSRESWLSTKHARAFCY